MRRKIAFILVIGIFSTLFNSNLFAQDISKSIGPVNSKDVIYQIITDRFYDGDESNNIPKGFDAELYDGTGNDLKLYQGGDWQGIIEKIPYLKGMGVTCVWISAPYANRDSAIIDKNLTGQDIWTSFHGYHVKNFYSTNLHFGDMKVFDNLRDELHKNGIKLVIDFVTNHTSRWKNPTDNFALEDGRLYEPDKNEQGKYVFDVDGNPVDYNGDGSIHNLLADPHNDINGWFHGLGDRMNDTSRFGFRHKELGSLADFSQENEKVVDYLEEAVNFWRDKGIDGIRHDATLHMNPAFIKGLKDSVDSNENGPLYHFGEFFIGRPDPKYEEYTSFPERTGVHNLDFEFYRTITSTFGDFSTDMKEFGEMLMYTQDDYLYENQTVTFIDNHDVTRFGYIQRNHKPYHAALVALMTSRGIPNIYYGTEQYIIPESSADIAGRVFMEAEVGFSETMAYRLIGKLSRLRQENNAIAYGQTKVLFDSEDVLVYERQFYDESVVIAINRQPDRGFNVPSIETSLQEGNYPDYLEGVLGGTHIGVKQSNEKNYLDGFYLDGGEVAIWASHRWNSLYEMFIGVNEITTPGSISIEENVTTPMAIKVEAVDTTLPKIGEVISVMGRPGNKVYIYGKDFGANPQVKFGDVYAEVIESTETRVICSVPYMKAGETHITIDNGNGKISNRYRYDVLTEDQNQVIFHVEAETVMGENVYIVGSVPELGGWDTNSATEAMMCPNYPEWFLPVSVPKGERIEFKFIKKDQQGNVTWEQGENRVIDTSLSSRGVIDTPIYTFGMY